MSTTGETLFSEEAAGLGLALDGMVTAKRGLVEVVVPGGNGTTILSVLDVYMLPIREEGRSSSLSDKYRKADRPWPYPTQRNQHFGVYARRTGDTYLPTDDPIGPDDLVLGFYTSQTGEQPQGFDYLRISQGGEPASEGVVRSVQLLDPSLALGSDVTREITALSEEDLDASDGTGNGMTVRGVLAGLAAFVNSRNSLHAQNVFIPAGIAQRLERFSTREAGHLSVEEQRELAGKLDGRDPEFASRRPEPNARFVDTAIELARAKRDGHYTADELSFNNRTLYEHYRFEPDPNYHYRPPPYETERTRDPLNKLTYTVNYIHSDDQLGGRELAIELRATCLNPNQEDQVIAAWTVDPARRQLTAYDETLADQLMGTLYKHGGHTKHMLEQELRKARTYTEGIMDNLGLIETIEIPREPDEKDQKHVFDFLAGVLTYDNRRERISRERIPNPDKIFAGCKTHDEMKRRLGSMLNVLIGILNFPDELAPEVYNNRSTELSSDVLMMLNESVRAFHRQRWSSERPNHMPETDNYMLDLGAIAIDERRQPVHRTKNRERERSHPALILDNNHALRVKIDAPGWATLGWTAGPGKYPQRSRRLSSLVSSEITAQSIDDPDVQLDDFTERLSSGDFIANKFRGLHFSHIIECNPKHKRRARKQARQTIAGMVNAATDSGTMLDDVFVDCVAGDDSALRYNRDTYRFTYRIASQHDTVQKNWRGRPKLELIESQS